MAEIKTSAVVMLDGPDGVGKTTQIQLLKKALEDDGDEVHRTRAHGGTPIGEALREVSLTKSLKRPAPTDLYLSAAIHAALAEDVNTTWNDMITLVDRSPLAMWAYQVYGDGMDKSIAEPILRRDLELFNPALVIVYKASVDVLKQRRQGSDYFESKPDSYFERVNEGYADAADTFGALTIDAGGSVEEVHELTLDAVHKALVTER